MQRVAYALLQHVHEKSNVVLSIVPNVRVNLVTEPLHVKQQGMRHQNCDRSPPCLVYIPDMRTTLLLATIALTSSAFVVPRGAPPPLKKIPSESFVADAEIKHGRVAMVSGAVLATLAANGFDHPTAVLSQCSTELQLMFFSAIGVAEAATYLPRLSSMFSLKEGVVPGQVFPRLTADAAVTSVELNLSRVIMMSVFLYMLYDVYRY